MIYRSGPFWCYSDGRKLSACFQMIQFIPLVIVPQVLFAGLIPISSMNIGLQYFAHLMPLFYTGQAMQDVMIKGFGIQDIYINLCILFGIFRRAVRRGAKDI